MVTALCNELGKLGARVELVSQDYRGFPDEVKLLPPADLVSTHLAAAYPDHRKPVFLFLPVLPLAVAPTLPAIERGGH